MCNFDCQAANSLDGDVFGAWGFNSPAGASEVYYFFTEFLTFPHTYLQGQYSSKLTQAVAGGRYG